MRKNSHEPLTIGQNNIIIEVLKSLAKPSWAFREQSPDCKRYPRQDTYSMRQAREI